jgi:hypothetical protein
MLGSGVRRCNDLHVASTPSASVLKEVSSLHDNLTVIVIKYHIVLSPSLSRF